LLRLLSAPHSAHIPPPPPRRTPLPQEWESLPSCFTTSSKEGEGRTELLGYLASLRRLNEQEDKED
jgi:hypothetical protein